MAAADTEDARRYPQFQGDHLAEGSRFEERRPVARSGTRQTGQHTNVKTESKIIAAAVLAALGLWLADAALDSFLLHESTFLQALLTQIPTEELYKRLVMVACLVISGVYLSLLYHRKQRLRESLDQSKQQMHNFFVEAPLPYQSLDQNGQIIEINRPWLLTLGYSAGEVIGRNFEQFLTPAYSEKYRNALLKLKAAGQFTGIELEVVRKDGSIVVASFNGKVVSDENGNFQRTQCLFVDITERHRFDKELQASEEKYRALVEHANEAIFVTQNDIVTFCNKRMSEILGDSVERITSEPFSNYIYATDREVALERHRRRLAGEEVSSIHDYRIIAADGSLKWLEINGILIEWEGKPATLNFANDITGRKHIEAAFQQQREWLETTLASIGDAVVVVDTDGNITFVNRAAEAICGWSDVEAIGRPIEQVVNLLDEINSRPIPNPVRAALQERTTVTLADHAMLQTQGGRQIPIDDSAAPILNRNGDLLGAVIVFRDITEHKRAEEALRLKNFVFDASIAAISIANLDGVITEANDAFLRIWGCSGKEEVIGKPIPHFFNDPNEAVAIVTVLNRTGQWEGDFTAKRKDGSTFIANFLAAVLHDQNGKMIGYQSAIIDITDRKRAEEALQTLLSRQEAIFSAVPDIIMEVDNSKIYSWANQAGLEFFGEDVLGKEVACYFEGEQETYDAVKPLFEGGENVFYVESWQRRKDGQKRLLAWWCRVLKDNNGNVTGALSSAQDITDRKLAEKALRESKERYKRLLESVTDYIYTVKVTDGKPVSTSHGEGCLTVTGYTSREFEENPYLWLQMIVEEDRPAVQEHVSSVMTGATISPLEHRIVHKKGLIRWVRNTPSVHADENGSIVSYEGLISDITERRAVADELVRSEIKYRTLFESAQDGIFLLKDYIFVDCNSITCVMFGCTREQILQQSPVRFSPAKQPDGADSAKKALEKIDEALAGRPQFFEWTHSKLDGSCFDAEVSLNGIEIAGEQHLLAIVRDITERKRSQNALERSLSLQHATLESTADGILVVDRAGKVSSFNRKYLEMWRIPEFLTVLNDDEPLLKYVVDQLKDPQRFLERVQQLYASPASQSYDTVEFKDGRVFERYSQPQRIGDEVVGRVWSFRDLTERNRVEMELARLATATEQAAEAIVIVNLDGQIEYVNPAFERISGYRRDETIGKNMSTMSSSEQDDDFHHELWRVLREGQVWTGRLRSCHKDGSVYEEECSISPIRDRNGVIVSYVAVKRDITQEAELENRLRQSQKLEAEGLLAAGIAHDFNNLLAGIRGFAELLTLDEEAGPKVSGYAQEILKAAGRAADLTGQLLAFARKGRFLSIFVNCHEVIDEVIAILERAIDRRIEIKQDYCAQRPFISGDPSQIQSAILNLAINARDAMPDGGRLTFLTENVHLDEAYCQLHSLDLGAGDYLAVSLVDTGVGMDETVIAHIFDPFFTTKALGQGTGLGLSGVYGCLRDHHGSVEVTSQLGSGSSFRLLFPVTAEEHEHALPSERRLQLTGEERLLLVEDEEVVRNLAVKILTNAGYRVTACADGQEAVALYRDGAAEFDLVLLDMMMPNMHGKDVFAAIKQINPQVRVLLMSGYCDSNVQEVLDQGIKGFIPKPFRSKQLLQKIREALETTTAPVEKQSQLQ
jgi:PAS domain S-box-containing protein